MAAALKIFITSVCQLAGPPQVWGRLRTVQSWTNRKVITQVIFNLGAWLWIVVKKNGI